MVKNLFEDLLAASAFDLMALRAADKALDEACNDFEELSELEADAVRRGDEDTGQAAQISIEEVKIEIRQRLSALLGPGQEIHTIGDRNNE